MVFGTAVSTTVLSGAIVDDRAVTSGTRVNSGAILSGGGFDVVNAGGTAISTTINSGGIEDDKGLTSATRINNGGIQVVDVGGTASGSFVNSGGVDVVVSGGTASNTTISGGGFMEVRSGGSVGSGTAVTFASGGVLQLDDSVHFGGRLVAGFGMPSLIDLRDIAFISGTTTLNWMQTGTSGTLTVTDGTPATTANITLLGQYAAGNFHIGNDGAGGTVVSDPPVSSTSQLALANTHQV